MACFIATGADARVQRLQVLTYAAEEQEFLCSIGANRITEAQFTITNQQFKDYMQWKQERCIAAKK